MTVAAACEWIFATPDVRAVLARMAAAGCDGIELAGEPARADRAELPAALEEAGIRAVGITAICMWPTQERDLAHPDADVRRRAVDYYRGCVDLAREVGAPAIGLIPAAVGRVDALEDRDREWEDAVAGTREVAAYAGEQGIAVGVEAVNRYETHLVRTAADALAFASDVGAPNVGVVLDAFHMQLEERDPAAAVAAAAPQMLALHLADSNRRGLGQGHLDAATIVRAARAAGYRGPLVFEFTAPGPNPFAADKGEEAMVLLDDELRRSVEAVAMAMNGA
jgi:D-psicose/D-tagatose/L-ribulose 3-epimerase